MSIVEFFSTIIWTISLIIQEVNTITFVHTGITVGFFTIMIAFVVADILIQNFRK